jgi:hypothetical protein
MEVPSKHKNEQLGSIKDGRILTTSRWSLLHGVKYWWEVTTVHFAR